MCNCKYFIPADGYGNKPWDSPPECNHPKIGALMTFNPKFKWNGCKRLVKKEE